VPAALHREAADAQVLAGPRDAAVSTRSQTVAITGTAAADLGDGAGAAGAHPRVDGR
jgi:hypothetical protein